MPWASQPPLLDRAASALGSDSEAAIGAALADLMRGRTVIAIAHRISMVKDVGRIVVLENGGIAKAGSRL